jgi:hypothetical protein
MLEKSIFKSNNIQLTRAIFYLRTMQQLKLFMVLIGATPAGRHTEQHDVFFGIAESLSALLPEMQAFWPEAAEIMHIDAWREVTAVDGYQINITQKITEPAKGPKLFFINLGGYQANKFEEQHYYVLTVKENRAQALKQAKETLFYRQNQIPGGVSHIDDRYGIDVDDLYEIADILSAQQKEKYSIVLTPAADMPADELHLGYLKISLLEANKI